MVAPLPVPVSILMRAALTTISQIVMIQILKMPEKKTSSIRFTRRGKVTTNVLACIIALTQFTVPASFQMRTSKAMLALEVLPLITITRIDRNALGHSIGANHPLNAAITGITIKHMSGAMPLWIAIPTEAAHMATVMVVTDTSPILLTRGAGRMIGHSKIPPATAHITVILPTTAAHPPEDTPPFEGMNMTTYPHLITNSDRQARGNRAVPSTGTVCSLGIFWMAHLHFHQTRWRSLASQATNG